MLCQEFGLMPKLSKSTTLVAAAALAMTASLAGAATTGGVIPAGMPQAGAPQVRLAANICGWYAIFQCARSPNKLGGPGRTINTNNYPNFAPGWFCRVIGPMGSRTEAQFTVNRGSVYSGGQGYVKNGC
jgi:hypothetical protein